MGVALRTVAALGRSADAVEPLREAVEVLEASELRLEHAYALHDLGAALRRAGARREARVPLRVALELAVACDAARLRDRARDELLASGARPRRIATTGRDALTPAELRVAELAAQGRANREIAQELFVTIKTIETQLSQAYSKLGIHGRSQLVDALSAEIATPSRSAAG
jgi:DNA-binding NarL/FixJ family response regulator